MDRSKRRRCITRYGGGAGNDGCRPGICWAAHTLGLTMTCPRTGTRDPEATWTC